MATAAVIRLPFVYTPLRDAVILSATMQRRARDGGRSAKDLGPRGALRPV